jgi:hypothetical protein
MSDPDFIDSVQAIRLEENVSKRSNKTPPQPTNNINITLRFEDESTLTISRSRLDNDFVQSAINRVTAKKNAAVSKHNIAATSHLASANTTTAETKDKEKRLSQPQTQIFSHLHQLDSNTIITPEQIKTLCQSNLIYHVISRPVIKIKDGGVLSHKQQQHGGTRITHSECHYDGSVLFVIRNVPTTSQNGMHPVSENDVRRWIVHGAISNTETVDVLATKVDALKESLLLVQQELQTRSKNHNPRSARGRLTSQSIKERKSESLHDEKKRLETLLQTTTKSLNALYTQHVEKCILSIKKTSKSKTFSTNGETCDWTVQVISGDEESDKTYTDLITKKNKNWSSVPLYAFGDCNTSVVSLTIPDEEKSDRFVDTGGVTMTKLPHGFGIYESYDEVLLSGSDKTKSRHRLYHGRFHEGQYSEGTLYTEAGVYTGKFDLSGHPTVGVMEYADGIKVSGQFASSGPKLNPYGRGVPHGDVRIKFPGKSTFQGLMTDGIINGEGLYMQEGVQLRGNFKDGVLEECEEGRNQNLNMSFMLGGERLWYPTTTRR